MEITLVEHNGVNIIESLPSGGFVNGEKEALELVAACLEYGTQRLLLPAFSLPVEFFRLRSGIAGEILLKLGNYRIITAALLSPEQIGDGKFKDWVIETNRGREFRVFFERNKALDWLASV